VYYQCPHNPAKPADAARHPGHPRTVKAPEKRLDQIAGLFFAEHVFGPRRADLLAAQLPATDQAAAAVRDAQAAALTARLKQIDTAQKAQILSLEQLSPDPGDTAATAMRARITDRFAELHDQREQAQAQLGALQAVTPKAADPTLLDQLPLAGDILTGLDPDLKARLFDAFDLNILWNKPGRQATVHVEITEATLRALPGILNPGQDGAASARAMSAGWSWPTRMVTSSMCCSRRRRMNCLPGTTLLAAASRQVPVPRDPARNMAPGEGLTLKAAVLPATLAGEQPARSLV
jgi:hypothetical protein